MFLIRALLCASMTRIMVAVNISLIYDQIHFICLHLLVCYMA